MKRKTAITISATLMIMNAALLINGGFGWSMIAIEQPDEVTLYGSLILDSNLLSLYLLAGSGLTRTVLVGAPLIWAAFNPAERAALCLFHVAWLVIAIPSDLYIYYGDSGIFQEMFTAWQVWLGVAFKSIMAMSFAAAWLFARKAGRMPVDATRHQSVPASDPA